MGNEYIAKKAYQIYIIVDTNAPSTERIYGLHDTHKSFSEYSDAKSWIETEGERHINYTILEVFRRP